MLSTVRSRPVVVFATLVIALVLVGWWTFTRPDGSQAAEVGSTETTEQTSEVTTGTMTETVAASGTIAAADTDELSFTSSGTVTAVKVEAGDQVKAGDVLARLDSVELEAAVADAQASLADAQARLDDAQDSDASDAELDAAQAAVTVARDQVDAAEQALDGATLTASIDGTVSDVSVAKGDVLGSGGADGTQLTGSGTGSGQSASTLGSGGGSALPGQAESSTTESSPHVAVTSTGSYVVELDVDATDIDAIAEGQSATITPSTSSGGFGAFPGGRFPGGGFPGGGFPGGGGPGGGDAFPGGGFPGGGAPGGGGQGGGDGQGGGQTAAQDCPVAICPGLVYPAERQPQARLRRSPGSRMRAPVSRRTRWTSRSTATRSSSMSAQPPMSTSLSMRSLTRCRCRCSR